ncbi:unnamed protein product [Rhizophagus irregularis]|nr:unnamed protein product [Rhizophagus irregularis]
MDLDSKTYSKLIDANNTYGGSAEYIRILDALLPLTKRHDYETPEMWCSLFIPRGYVFNRRNQDNHLKRCISGNTISNEHARRNEILKSIDAREFQIWQYKQYILQEEAKINRLRLELFSQSTSHSEKDKLALVSYDYDSDSITYETYKQIKMTMAENTMPSAEPACISPARQEIVSPNSYQSSNYKSDTGELFISSQYVKQPKGTMLRLRDGESTHGCLTGLTDLGNLSEAYFDSVRKNAGRK